MRSLPRFVKRRFVSQPFARQFSKPGAPGSRSVEGQPFSSSPPLPPPKLQSHRGTGSVVTIALAASPHARAQTPPVPWKPAAAPLMTRWAEQVDPTTPLPEYPRPQMVRQAWQSLNGLWDLAVTDKEVAVDRGTYEDRILVPFPYESALSGVGKASVPDKKLWYRRSFTVPEAWKGQRVRLHFGAVNWDSTVSVNGKPAGEHRGGYDSFSFDVTDLLQPGENRVNVSAWNPLRANTGDAQVLGKQRAKSGGIFYTAATGIWQSVWLEPVPTLAVDHLKITPDLDGQSLRLTVDTGGKAGTVKAVALDGGREVGAVTGAAGTELHLPVPQPHPWTPQDPHLYGLRVTLMQEDKAADAVDSYFAMRKVSLGKDDQGRTRLMLNNQFVFQVGVLDQGYWPDGIYTAPTDEALRYDIEAMKALGFNLSRKHAKVEPARWYYWTDKLGLLVWQDMPQMFGKEDELTEVARAEFAAEWRRIVAQLYNVPSIVVWTTFNEGWGQHDTAQIVDLTRELDPTRLVNSASGWTDKGVGDLHDTHAYPGPWAELPEPTRAAVNGEFGGVTMSVDGHRWLETGTKVFGYGTVLKDNRIVTKRYQALLKNAYRLKDERGMSAVVYTQLTDVEQEINGLLTYDRAVIKPDVNLIAAANRGEFPTLPPNPYPDLLPTSEEEPQKWRYTTAKPDGNAWTAPEFSDAAWKTGAGVFGHDMDGVSTQWTTSDIWLRREFDLPEGVPSKLEFSIKHDEDAEVYLNGVLAGTVHGYNKKYDPLPIHSTARAALKPGGRNVIAVHCHQTVSAQGIDVGIVAGGE